MMGFFSRLVGLFKGKQSKPSPQVASASKQPSTIAQSQQSTSAAKTATPEPEPVVAAQKAVEQVSRELEAISQTILPDAAKSAETVTQPGHETDDSLSEKILGWGKSGQTRYIPQLVQYTHSSDSDLRATVATALGNIAAANPRRAEVQQIIPVLGKLSYDRQPNVSQSAVTALGQIPSKQVLPFLQRALKHPSSVVVKAASLAIRQLKLHYQESAETPTVKRPPKPIHHRF